MAEVRFDKYLNDMARSISGDGFTCSAVLPDVDGGLLFLVREGSSRPRRVKMEYQGASRFEKTVRFKPGNQPWSRAVEAGFHRYIESHPHPLLGFEGQDINEIVLREGVPLQEVWRRHLEPGRTRFNTYRLQRMDLSNGALHLKFEGAPGPVGLRITDREDPRLDQAHEHLFVNNLALALVEDGRRKSPPPAEQVERWRIIRFDPDE